MLEAFPTLRVIYMSHFGQLWSSVLLKDCFIDSGLVCGKAYWNRLDTQLTLVKFDTRQNSSINIFSLFISNF